MFAFGGESKIEIRVYSKTDMSSRKFTSSLKNFCKFFSSYNQYSKFLFYKKNHQFIFAAEYNVFSKN